VSFSNPYALWRSKDRLVEPSLDLPRSRDLPGEDGYDCPNCQGELKLAKGKVIPPYFAHISNDDLDTCTEESVLHRTASLLLAQTINDWATGRGEAPKLNRHCDRCRRAVVTTPPAAISHADTVNAAGARQDVTCLNSIGAVEMAIQVRATHARPAVPGAWLELGARAILEDPLDWRPLNWGGLSPIPSCGSCEAEIQAGFSTVEPTNPYYVTGQDLAGKIFGAGGLMSQVMDGYEERSGQRKLAAAIDRAIQQNRSLMAEGPCGTGKSAAYLAVALSHALHTGGTVLVSTANKSLQDQLYDKDVGQVLAALGKPNTPFELVRGRSNYLCQWRLDAWAKEKKNEDHAVVYWSHETKDGDVMRAPFELEGKVKRQVCGSQNECSAVCSSTAKEGDPCFYQKARKRAKKATLVITNHSMLFAHLSVKRKVGEAVVLPDADILICDEGHELVDYARGFFETSYAEGRCKRLGLSDEERKTLDGLEAALFEWAKVATRKTDGNLDGPWINGTAEEVGRKTLTEVARIKKLLTERFERISDEILYEYGDDEENYPPEVRQRISEAQSRVKEAEKMEHALTDVLELRDDLETKAPKAYWLEYSDRGTPSLKGCPVDVSSFIRENLFTNRSCSTIVTSATLTTAGTFDHLGKEIGFVTDQGYVGDTCMVESPFDFERQSIFVVPDRHDMPHEPSGKGREPFMARSAELFQWVAGQTGGGVLFLFASRAGMNAVRKRLPKNLPYRVLVQGDMSTKRLKEEFRDDVDSCLFGLKTFWAGLDVQGHALRCVIVDKMPFTPPSDPFQYYREKRAGLGRGAFEYSLQEALLQLRQGVGRLIRTTSDGGAAVILDRRILSRPSYSSKVMSSLPWKGGPRQGLLALQRYFNPQVTA
jgi:ATP-dependent DNA helicase DinG